MIVSIALLLTTAQVKAPVLPPGVHPEFTRAALAVQERLERSDWAGAQRMLGLLPAKNIAIVWDDSKVPAELREKFGEARDRAMFNWSKHLPGVNITIANKGHVKFSFEPVLAESAESGLPAGIALFWSPEPKAPRLEAVIGLKRGNPLQALTPIEVHNEVAYALGAYIGLAPNPIFGSYMGRSDMPMQAYTGFRALEESTGQAVVRAADQIRTAVQKKQRMPAAKPDVFLDPVQLDAGKRVQGAQVPFQLQVTNRGTGTLTYRLVPDCGCFALQPPGSIEAGSTQLLKLEMDTSEFIGDVHKRIVLMTNDVDSPTKVIDVHASLTPKFRFLNPAGDVILLEDGGAFADVYLAITEGQKLSPTSARLEGFEGGVAMQAWEGSLADPELGEETRPRKGYKFTFRIPDDMPSGRSSGTLVVETDDPVFPTLRYSVYAQKGIVALPSQLYMGSFDNGPRAASFIISRPGKPFKVLSVDSPLPSFRFTITPSRGDSEYKVDVVYDGKAPRGDLRTTVKVTTDDPNQKEILIPLRAILK